MNKTIIINTDGGSRGNPGPAAIGVVFSNEAGEIIHCYNEYIGSATNNEAEYQGIIRALQILEKSRWFQENNTSDSNVLCRLDSQLVVEQINGGYKVKQDHIREFIEIIRALLKTHRTKTMFFHIPREENKFADKLVNQALDKELKNKT
jgi:ribonuclease HI